jgi:kinesin family protein 18/19
MDFDSVFNEDSVNLDIFEKCMKPLVNSVMDGYNCSVFVYGATGAGKTYTMLGSDEIPGKSHSYRNLVGIFFCAIALTTSLNFQE